MKTKTALTWTAAALVAVLSGCSSTGSLGEAMSLYQKLGGSSTVSSLANDLVGSSLKDPRLAGLTSGKSVDAAGASSKVSDQLCSMLGGGCQAPLTSSQISSAASKVSTDQAKAISDNFGSSLGRLVSDPAVRDLVTKAVGSKLPGVLGGLL